MACINARAIMFPLSLIAPVALAIDFETANPDLKIRWDNTIQYSAAARLKHPSLGLIAAPQAINQDDGDRDFGRGLISNRLDWFSGLDIAYKQYGARLSAAAWYDAVYNRSNDNDSPSTANALSVPFNQFTEATRRLHGRYAEILDAFVSGKTDIADMPVSWRIGQYSLYWGKSRSFVTNSIAFGQIGVDVNKVRSIPNAQIKDVVRPDRQISGQAQLNPDFSVEAYYKFSWEKLRLPAAGSYFSVIDVAGDGAERLFAGGGPQYLSHAADITPRNSGQGGMQLKWRPHDTGLEMDAFAIRYHDRVPKIYIFPGAGANLAIGQLGSYRLAYPENIFSYGGDASMDFGPVRLAGEVSVRRNAPLVSAFQIVPPGVTADNDKNPRYAVGNTIQAVLAGRAKLGPNPVANEAYFTGELAWNRTLSVTKNPGALSPATRDALGMRFTYTPFYRQISSGLDISVPVGLSYFPKGRSSAVPGFGTDKGGDMSIGINGSYLKSWEFSLLYTHFYGREGLFINNAGQYTFAQPLKDRDYVVVSISRTF